MLLRDFISPATVIGEVSSTTRDEALAEILDTMAERGALLENLRNGLLEALIQREEIASTAIGNGVAVPHAKHPGIAKLTGIVARCREGVMFQQPPAKPLLADKQIVNPHAGQPVYLVVMMLSNQQLIAQHLAALGYVGKMLIHSPEMVTLIRNAHDEKAIWNLLLENDKR
jgi:PTS system fructose-specific IIA component/PTS system nitrogen regulatory IIA component